MPGWIKLHRRLLNWEWYNDLPTFRLFTHLLLTVNYEKKTWRGIEIMPGQIVTGRKKLSQETGLTERQIRTSITALKTTNELTTKKIGKYTVYSILRWVDYQENDHNNVQQTTTKTTTKTTTTKEDKKKRSKEYNVSKLSLTERQQLFYDDLKQYTKTYPKETLRAFYEYWTEPNRSQTRLRHELEKTWDTARRLKNWARREKPSSHQAQKPVSYSHIKPYRPQEDDLDPQLEKELMTKFKVLTQ